MAIPTNDFLIKPYNDDHMIYQLENHRYVLTVDNANWQTGLDLLDLWQTQENLEWYLEYVSRVAYTYIYSLKQPKYKKKMEYYLSHSKYMREAIEAFLIDMITYNFEDGGFLIAYQTGMNLKEMKELPMSINNAASVVGRKIVENYTLAHRVIEYDFELDNKRGEDW